MAARPEGDAQVLAVRRQDPEDHGRTEHQRGEYLLDDDVAPNRGDRRASGASECGESGYVVLFWLA